MNIAKTGCCLLLLCSLGCVTSGPKYQDTISHNESAGKSVVLKKFPLDATGPWVVRVSGKSSTEGAYTVSFKIKNAKPIKLKKQVPIAGFLWIASAGRSAAQGSSRLRRIGRTRRDNAVARFRRIARSC